jgi:SulP family sulfate permease
MTGARLTPAWIYLLSLPNVMLRWLPGIVLACVLLIVLRRWTHALITPAIILIAVILFYAAITAGGLSVEQARERSWMLGPFPAGSLFQFLTPTAFQDANWAVVLRQADKIAAVLLVSVVALLLNASGIELSARRDLDFNRELIAAGLPGYHLLGATTLSYRLGARSRLTGITAAVLIGFTLLFGASLLEYFPRPVLGGLLAYLGIAFLVEWLYDAWFQLSIVDYLLIVLILVIIAVFGFLPGVAVGIVISVILFVVNYSRIHVVKHALTGINYRSSVDRSHAERAFLRKHGEQLWILQLQEYIFFGTAQNLLDQVRARIQNVQRVPLRFLVLDFRRVPGLDSSAVASFLRLLQLAQAQQIELVLADVAPNTQKQLKRGGVNEGAHYFPSLDLGVEWCESKMLAEDAQERAVEPLTFQAQLARVLPNAGDLERLDTYLRRLEVPAETVLIHQGEAAHALYFIETGKVSVQLELPDGKSVRLRTIHHGTVIGEVAMYSGTARTASVVTLEPTVAHRLTAAAITEMERRDPDLAAALHKWIAGVMAERLADNVRTLEAVMN